MPRKNRVKRIVNKKDYHNFMDWLSYRLFERRLNREDDSYCDVIEQNEGKYNR